MTAEWVTVTVEAATLRDAQAAVEAQHDNVGLIGQCRKIGGGMIEVKFLPLEPA